MQWLENMEWLGHVANLAAILTAALAVWFWAYYRHDIKHKRVLLEDHLREEKDSGNDRGQRSILNLMAELGLTEDEILRASFGSKKILRRVHVSKETNLADSLLFEYDAEPKRPF
jgi:hypothetical protein